ncbi:MAG: hypothetical protein ACWA5Q_10610, partial [bacterium]
NGDGLTDRIYVGDTGGNGLPGQCKTERHFPLGARCDGPGKNDTRFQGVPGLVCIQSSWMG